jgi:hypothetical protein
MPTFHPRHIPALFCSFTFTFLGFHPCLPLFLPFLPQSLQSSTFVKNATANAMSEYGLPPNLQQSYDAQTVFTLYACRMVCFGICLFVFWYQGWDGALDVVMSTFALMGGIDGLVCMRVGLPWTGAWRSGMGLLLGLWGMMGGNQGKVFGTKQDQAREGGKVKSG